MTYKILTIAALAVSTATACASSEATPSEDTEPRQCFRTDQISGFSSIDRDTLRVRVSGQRRFDLEVQGPGCSDVEWSHTAAFINNTGSSLMCAGRNPVGAEIRVRDQMGFCRVRNVSYVTPETEGDETTDTETEN
ncbi:DUF6491 family protein [Maricaulis sp. D1M11]|uniref:DUF6491 family protein n=1 Tax=Maricaulis sp. D1M11 TaxID=3076117 RepID=UPI0039B5BF7E